MTLSGYFTLNSVFALVFLAPETANLENNSVKSNKDRPILSLAQISSRDSSFWRYKVYAI